jgi:hypothetical protein
MKVELKKFKSYPRLSEETTAYNADIWIDGKFAATAENNGKGGCDNIRFDDHDLEKRFYAFCEAQPDLQSQYGPLKMNSDLFIGTLVEKLEHAKWLKNQSKKKVLFTLPDQKAGTYSTVSFKTAAQRPAAIAYVKQKYPQAVIVEV